VKYYSTRSISGKQQPFLYYSFEIFYNEAVIIACNLERDFTSIAGRSGVLYGKVIMLYCEVRDVQVLYRIW